MAVDISRAPFATYSIDVDQKRMEITSGNGIDTRSNDIRSFADTVINSFQESMIPILVLDWKKRHKTTIKYERGAPVRTFRFFD